MIEATRYLAQRFCARTGVDVTLEEGAFFLLQKEVERALVRLLHLERVTVSVPCITQGQEGPLHLDDVLSREDIERLTSIGRGV